MGLGVIGLERDRAAVGFDRIRGVAAVFEGAAEAVMRRREVGIDVERTAIAGDGGLGLAAVPEHRAEVGVIRGRGAAAGDRLADQAGGGGAVAARVGDEAEVVQRLGVVGLGGQDPLVVRRGFGEPPLLVEPDRGGERLGDRRRRVAGAGPMARRPLLLASFATIHPHLRVARGESITRAHPRRKEIAAGRRRGPPAIVLRGHP